MTHNVCADCGHIDAWHVLRHCLYPMDQELPVRNTCTCTRGETE